MNAAPLQQRRASAPAPAASASPRPPHRSGVAARVITLQLAEQQAAATLSDSALLPRAAADVAANQLQQQLQQLQQLQHLQQQDPVDADMRAALQRTWHTPPAQQRGSAKQQAPAQLRLRRGWRASAAQGPGSDGMLPPPALKAGARRGRPRRSAAALSSRPAAASPPPSVPGPAGHAAPDADAGQAVQRSDGAAAAAERAAALRLMRELWQLYNSSSGGGASGGSPSTSEGYVLPPNAPRLLTADEERCLAQVVQQHRKLCQLQAQQPEHAGAAAFGSAGSSWEAEDADGAGGWDADEPGSSPSSDGRHAARRDKRTRWPPPLTDADVAELRALPAEWRAMLPQLASRALELLVLFNTRLIPHMLRFMPASRRRAMPLGDLVAAGMTGLRAAALRYDPERGTRFSTVATQWIGQHLQRNGEELTAAGIRRPAHHHDMLRYTLAKHGLGVLSDLGSRPDVLADVGAVFKAKPATVRSVLESTSQATFAASLEAPGASSSAGGGSKEVDSPLPWAALLTSADLDDDGADEDGPPPLAGSHGSFLAAAGQVPAWASSTGADAAAGATPGAWAPERAGSGGLLQLPASSRQSSRSSSSSSDGGSSVAPGATASDGSDGSGAVSRELLALLTPREQQVLLALYGRPASLGDAAPSVLDPGVLQLYAALRSNPASKLQFPKGQLSLRAVAQRLGLAKAHLVAALRKSALNKLLAGLEAQQQAQPLQQVQQQQAQQQQSRQQAVQQQAAQQQAAQQRQQQDQQGQQQQHQQGASLVRQRLVAARARAAAEAQAQQALTPLPLQPQPQQPLPHRSQQPEQQPLAQPPSPLPLPVPQQEQEQQQQQQQQQPLPPLQRQPQPPPPPQQQQPQRPEQQPPPPRQRQRRAAQPQRLPGAVVFFIGLLQQFAAQHRRLPRDGEVFEGRGLGAYVTKQRRRYARGELAPAVVAAFEAQVPGWSWDMPAGAPPARPPRAPRSYRSWDEVLGLLSSYVSAHGHLPRSTVRWRDFGLGQWLCAARLKARRGRLEAWRIAALDAAAPGWLAPDEARRQREFESRLARLAAFVAQHGGLPSSTVRSDGSGGVDLYSWMSMQRAQHAAGRLPPARHAALEAVPGWHWAGAQRRPQLDRAFAAMLRRLAAFVEEHGRLPEARDAGAAMLHRFCRTMRHRHMNGRLRPERAAALEALPGWDWHRARSFDAWLALLAGYVAQHGVQPWASARWQGACLGQWCQRQRVKHAAGKLPPEHVAALEAVRGWDWAWDGTLRSLHPGARGMAKWRRHTHDGSRRERPAPRRGRPADERGE